MNKEKGLWGDNEGKKNVRNAMNDKVTEWSKGILDEKVRGRLGGREGESGWGREGERG